MILIGNSIRVLPICTACEKQRRLGRDFGARSSDRRATPGPTRRGAGGPAGRGQRHDPRPGFPTGGRLVGTETFAQRAVARAFLKVGALRTLEIVLAQLPGAVDLATTP